MAASTITNQDKILTSQLGEIGWYPSNREKLQHMIESFISNAKPPKLTNIKALILPHAGYAYSGQSAGHGLSLIKNKPYNRVFILGPSHKTHMVNAISIPDATHIQTPLGTVECDTKIIEQLKHYPFFKNTPAAHENEHSVQIEIPLLQQSLSEFKIIPIIVGHLNKTTSHQIAQILKQFIDENTLFVVSSDFTHYGNAFGYMPFDQNIEANLKKLDMNAYQAIDSMNPQSFFEYTEKTGATICGKHPISILLNMMDKKTDKAHLLNYTTSGALTNEWDHSVSYMTIAFTGDYQKEQPLQKNTTQMDTNELSPKDKENGLTLARKTIEYYLTHNKKPMPNDLNIAVAPGLKNIFGAFVTLHKHDQLRGCIGEIVPYRPLYEAIIDQAINAAVNDSRFPAVTQDEINDIDIEISALTAPIKVNSYKDIVIGKHGIVLQKRKNSAVFLPQVAPEQGWNRAETLSHLSEKAWLPANAWQQPDCEFYVFEAIIFNEKGHVKK